MTPVLTLVFAPDRNMSRTVSPEYRTNRLKFSVEEEIAEADSRLLSLQSRVDVIDRQLGEFGQEIQQVDSVIRKHRVCAASGVVVVPSLVALSDSPPTLQQNAQSSAMREKRMVESKIDELRGSQGALQPEVHAQLETLDATIARAQAQALKHAEHEKGLRAEFEEVERKRNTTDPEVEILSREAGNLNVQLESMVVRTKELSACHARGAEHSGAGGIRSPAGPTGPARECVAAYPAAAGLGPQETGREAERSCRGRSSSQGLDDFFYWTLTCAAVSL